MKTRESPSAETRLGNLVSGVRDVTRREADWAQTAELVAGELSATGDVTGLAPPGDIHRVRNIGNQTAISLHIYGTDVSRLGSSIRRVYHQPVVAAPTA